MGHSRLGARMALMALLVACSAGAARGQLVGEDPWRTEREFLSREYYPLWSERYENYSLLSYRDYGIRPEYPTYDPFGTYMIDGQNILRVSEYRTLAPNESSYQYWNLGRFRNMVIMRDNYGGWGTRFMMGNLLEGTFTPLTLNLARLEGFRWDSSSYRNRFTGVVSRVPRPMSDWRYFTAYIYGGRWESRLGDMVRFGATYVNFHLHDGGQRKGGLDGQVPTRLEGSDEFYVIVSDDSPGDEYGARLYDVQIVIDGVTMPLETTEGLEPGIFRVRDVVRADWVSHIRRHDAWAPRIPTADRLLRANTGTLALHGIPVSLAGGPLTVTGTDLLVVKYKLPAAAESVAFRLQVAGDYSIDVAADYGFQGGGLNHWSDWHNAARAPGNVKDGSNLRWVTVDYGFPTGVELYGFDATVDVFGARVEGEYVRNLAHHQFPFNGDRHKEDEAAYYLKLSRDMHPWGIGAEVFDMPSEYRTELPVWSDESQTVLRYDLIEDNDDRDEWPDIVEHWDPTHPVYQTELQTETDVDAKPPATADDYGLSGGYGVYPGLDQNQDGTLDTNINRNEFPDHTEPFFMYAADPDEFVYGDDFNNNGIVDSRENDNNPEYPYDRDQRGYHGFVGWNGIRGVECRLGRYHIEQHAGDGRNEVSYGEVRIRRDTRWSGELDFNLRVKRIQDDIPDPVYQVVFDQSTRATVVYQLRSDPLLTTNSLLSTVFARSRIEPVPGLNITNAGKYERNDRREESEISGDIAEYTWLSKADYAHTIGHLTISPMAKLMVRRRSAPGRLAADIQTLEAFSILRLDYELSPRTRVRLGMQGLPGMPHICRDEQAPSTEFDARHFIFVLQNRSNYTGHDLSINLGFRRSSSDLISMPDRRAEKYTEVFLQARVL